MNHGLQKKKQQRELRATNRRKTKITPLVSANE